MFYKKNKEELRGGTAMWSVLLSRHGLRKGDGLILFSLLFFFEYSVVKATLKFPPGL
jgi:hypothetical protein